MSGIILQESVSSDLQLVEMWVYGKADHTQRYYRAEAEKFLAKVDKAWVRVTLADLQSYAEGLGAQRLQASSQARSLAVLKSLFAFGHKIGVLLYFKACVGFLDCDRVFLQISPRSLKLNPLPESSPTRRVRSQSCPTSQNANKALRELN